MICAENTFVRSVIIIYFTGFEEEYIPAILRLEKKSYPKELVLGEIELRADSKKPEFKNYSICCFSGGELVGYIIAYDEQNPGRSIYISDINCTNPKYLGRLLMKFFSVHNGAVFEGDFRKNSYTLLCNQQKKENGLVFILEQKFMPQYYDNGEDAYYVRFTVNAGVYLEHNWKNRFQSHLDNIRYYDYDNLMSYVFESIYELTKEGIDFYAKKNMKYVIQCLKENILDYYQMFDDNIPYKFVLHMYIRCTQEEKGIKAFEKSILKLKELGYKEGSEGNSYKYDTWNKRLTVSREGIMSNTYYKDKLSGVRWLWKRHLQFKGDREDKFGVTYYNKYGVKHNMIKVPYLTKKNYLFYLDRTILELGLLDKIKVNELEKSSLHKIIVDSFFLLGSKDASKCVNSIVERYKGGERNYFHDWGIILDDLKSVGYILTKGAKITILCGSYNQALRICKHVMSIKQTVLDDSLARRAYSVKEIRKKVSGFIRNHKDCMPYVKELCNSVTEYYSEKLNIPVAVRKMIPEYMDRIQKYNSRITIYTLYRIFGRECLSQYVLGTYDCIFTPKIIYPPFDELCIFIKDILQKRTKKAKRLYGKLLKGGLLPAVIDNSVTFNQYNEIIKILKHHNMLDMDETIKNLCDFRAYIEPKGSPEFITAGDATVCCMSFGTEKAKTYAIEEGFGILNIYYQERVIANSVIWINSPYRCLVLDNIEVHPNYIKYSKQLELCFCAAAEYLMKEQQLDSVVQGLNYNDLRLYQEDTEEYCFSKMEPLKVQTKHFYSDAKYYKIVMQKSNGLNDASNHNNEVVAA